MSIRNDTRRESYSCILPHRQSRQRVILEILEGKELTADEITQLLFEKGHIQRNQ